MSALWGVAMSGWRLKIAHKLPLALIGAALIACLCVGAGSYFVADRSVAGLTQEKMETMAQERARELGDYFAAAKEDLWSPPARATPSRPSRA